MESFQHQPCAFDVAWWFGMLIRKEHKGKIRPKADKALCPSCMLRSTSARKAGNFTELDSVTTSETTLVFNPLRLKLAAFQPH